MQVISPLMPWRQEPLLVLFIGPLYPFIVYCFSHTHHKLCNPIPTRCSSTANQSSHSPPHPHPLPLLVLGSITHQKQSGPTHADSANISLYIMSEFWDREWDDKDLMKQLRHGKASMLMITFWDIKLSTVLWLIWIFWCCLKHFD